MRVIAFYLQFFEYFEFLQNMITILIEKMKYFFHLSTFLKNVHWIYLLYEEWHFIRKTIILNILWSHYKMLFDIVSFTIKYISSLSFHDFFCWTISFRFLQTLICHTSSLLKQFRDFFAVYKFDLRPSCSYITHMILLIFFVQCEKLVRLFVSRSFFFICDWTEYVFNIKIANWFSYRAWPL